jgi:DNA-binding MarR family transcriptional regulator
MTTKRPSSSVQCAVRLRASVFHLSRRLRSTLLQETGSLAALSVLGHLHRGGPLSPTDLAARDGVKLQSLTRLLAGIEAEGWAARQPNPADRRQSVLSLTPQGLKRLQAGVQAGEASLASAIEKRLGAEDRALLLRACELMDALADAMEGGAAADAKEEGVP